MKSISSIKLLIYLALTTSAVLWNACVHAETDSSDSSPRVSNLEFQSDRQATNTLLLAAAPAAKESANPKAASPKVQETVKKVAIKKAFIPKQVTTGPLKMTGFRFEPVIVTTSALTMTGFRFEPVVVTTSALKMTGFRFDPKIITTAPLKMTGMRSTATTPPVRRTTEIPRINQQPPKSGTKNVK